MAAIVAGAGALAAVYAGKATHWAVMSDELQTARLAISIVDDVSPAPRIHGQAYGSWGQQLYPLLLAPWFAVASAPVAIHAAHLVNGFLLASAAIPAYLIGRDVTRSRLAGCVAAALTAFAPWLVLSATILTENAAYPAFVWAVYLCQRAVARASPWRDAWAIAGILLAYFARTQLVLVAIAFAVAVVVHELALELAERRGSRLRALRRGLGRAVALHPLAAAAYGVGIVGGSALVSSSGLGSVFGNYAGTLRGSLLPAGLWQASAAHLDYVVVALGIAPFVLTLAWLPLALVRPRRVEAHAFALLTLVLVPLLTLQVASFDLRFTPGAFVQDRYLFYLAPLLAVGAVAALLETERPLVRAGLVAAGGGLFAALAAAATFSAESVIFWASPAAAFHPALGAIAGALDASRRTLVVAAAIGVGLVLAAAVVHASPPVRLVVVGAVLTGFGAFEAVYALDRYAVPATTAPRTIPSAPADWIDRSAPSGEAVTLVPSPYLPQEFWWDAELWNERVDYVLRVGRSPTFTPFPVRTLSVDPTSGAVRGGLPSGTLVETNVETRFRLAGARRIASAPPLELVAVAAPYRAEWVTAGADADGWVRPGRAVTIRLFPTGARAPRSLAVTLSPPPGADASARVELARGAIRREARLRPGPPTSVSIGLCLPARRPASVTLRTRGGTRIAGGRFVAAHLDRVDERPLAGRCRGSAGRAQPSRHVRVRRPGPRGAAGQRRR